MSFGFGHGPFGKDPFGEWAWAKYVLFDTLPSLHRARDADPDEGNGALQAFMDALRPSFETFQQQIREFENLRDPLRVRSQHTDVEVLRLGPVVDLRGPIEQRGIEGRVLGSTNFFAQRGRFRDRDRGKILTVYGSKIPSNNRTVAIASVVSLQEVVTVPSLVFDPTDNLLRWELREPLPTAEDEVTVEVQAGDVSKIAPGWVLTDGRGQFEVVARRQFRDPSVERKSLTEREGRDGLVDALGQFVSPTLVTTQADVGKKLTLSGSLLPENNDKFDIVEVTSAGAMILDPTPTPDGGPLVWATLPRPELVLRSAIPPTGVVDQSGFDGQVDPDVVGATDIFRAESGDFKDGDTDKVVFIRGSETGASNDGPYRVLEVLSSRRLRLDAVFTVPDTGSGALFWELRPATLIGDLTEVEVRPSSLLELLAQDFGIRLDRQESEARQRSWVRNTHQWTSIKGLQKSYSTIAKISGFDSVISQLFRITQDIATTVAVANLIEVGEAEAGRIGTDGSLTFGTGRVRLSAPSAAFRMTDIGRQIRLGGSGSGNDGLRTIDRFIDARTVEFRLSDGATTPDANNGSLTWSVVRLYTDLPPLLPQYDEILVELLEELVAQTFIPFTNTAFDITTVGVASLIDGETFTVEDGVNPAAVFEFDKVPDGVTAGNIQVDISAAVTADDVRDAIISAVNGVGDTLQVTAGVGGAGLVSLTHDANGQIRLTETVGAAGFVVVGGFLPGDVITGATSGATATVVSIEATGALQGTFRLGNLDGTFLDAEVVNSTLNGAGTLDLSGPPQGVFSVDRFCWESDFFAEVSVKILSVTSQFLDQDTQIVEVEGPANVIEDIGNWILVDPTGTEFFVDSVPEGVLDYDNQTQGFAVGQELLGPQTLAYDGFAGPGFAAGSIVTGSTSGATAVIVDDENAGVSGVLSLTQVRGFFTDNEAITQGGNSALADGFVAKGSYATIVAVEENGLSGTLTLSGVRGLFRDDEPIFSITDVDGDNEPDGVTVLGAAQADGVLRYRFTTRIATPPQVSAAGQFDALLRYVCRLQVICGYCPSYVALANVIETSILGEEGVAVEKALERVLRRFSEVTPAHVQLVPRFTRTIDLNLNLSLELGEWVAATSIIYLFLTGLFDLGVPVDLVPLDVMLKLTKQAALPHPTADVSGSGVMEMDMETTALGYGTMAMSMMASGTGTVS